MNAIDLMKLEHLQIERLLWKIACAKRTKSQRVLFEEMADRLAAHMALEERYLQPAIARLQSDLVRDPEEHLALKELLSDLRLSTDDPDAFDAKLMELRELVVRHHGEEEEKLFPSVRALLDPDALDALGNQMNVDAAVFKAGHPRRAIHPGMKHAV